MATTDELYQVIGEMALQRMLLERQVKSLEGEKSRLKVDLYAAYDEVGEQHDTIERLEGELEDAKAELETYKSDVEEEIKGLEAEAAYYKGLRQT